jgi:16S rRNA (cytosine967-C5)-methyltransferase
VIERKLTLDFILTRYCKLPLHKLNPEVLQILRCALYQLCWLDSVPDNAAVHEAVELTRAFRKTSASGFVNGVLRAFLRDGKRIPEPQGTPARRLSIRYSCGEELVAHLMKHYGLERTEGFLAASLGRPPLYIRVNTCRTTPEVLALRLQEQGVVCEPDPTLPAARGFPPPARSSGCRLWRGALPCAGSGLAALRGRA